MGVPRKKRNHIILGDDGELHQPIDDPASRQDAIFCAHCSAPNLPDARFCNKCGEPLAEQRGDSESQSDNLEKRKNNRAGKPQLATYDPSRYEAKEKRPNRGNKLVSVILALIVSGAFIFSLLIRVVLFVNSHPSDGLTLLLAFGAVAGIWLLIRKTR